MGRFLLENGNTVAQQKFEVFDLNAIFKEMVIYNYLPQLNDLVVKAMDDFEADRQKASAQFK